MKGEVYFTKSWRLAILAAQQMAIRGHGQIGEIQKVIPREKNDDHCSFEVRLEIAKKIISFLVDLQKNDQNEWKVIKNNHNENEVLKMKTVEQKRNEAIKRHLDEKCVGWCQAERRRVAKRLLRLYQGLEETCPGITECILRLGEEREVGKVQKILGDYYPLISSHQVYDGEQINEFLIWYEWKGKIVSDVERQNKDGISWGTGEVPILDALAVNFLGYEAVYGNPEAGPPEPDWDDYDDDEGDVERNNSTFLPEREIKTVNVDDRSFTLILKEDNAWFLEKSLELYEEEIEYIASEISCQMGWINAKIYECQGCMTCGFGSLYKNGLLGIIGIESDIAGDTVTRNLCFMTGGEDYEGRVKKVIEGLQQVIERKKKNKQILWPEDHEFESLQKFLAAKPWKLEINKISLDCW